MFNKKTLIYFTNALLLLFDELISDPEGAADQVAKTIISGYEFIYPGECQRRDREVWKKRFVDRLLANMEVENDQS